MTRRRFYAPPSAFNTRHAEVTLAEDEARYLREVLRLKPGAEVYVFDGVGNEFQCVVEESRRETARLKVIGPATPASLESALQFTLAVALLKGEKFDLVVQKATELGVTQIVPVTTQFADIRLKDKADATKRVARWQRIALEASKQSGRAVVPEVSTPLGFEELVSQSNSPQPADARFLFSERDGAPLAVTLKHLPETPTILTALVGPEGGWATEEIALAREAGWSIVTLSGRTLRAETAAIAVTTLLQHFFGDLR